MRDINILVVARDQALIEAAKESFAPLGYQVVPAHGISLGLFLAQKNFPALILCQPELQDSDGDTFLAEIKLDAELIPIPFVFVDHKDSQHLDKDKALAAGACSIEKLSADGKLDVSRLIPLIERRLLTKTKRQEHSPE